MTSTMMDLNYDLLADIFTRLPKGSIPRLKAVCKEWYALLSDPWLRTKLPHQTIYGLYIDIMFSTFWSESAHNIFLSQGHYVRPPGFAHTEQNRDANNNLKNVTFDYLPTGRRPRSDETVRIVDVSDGLLLCNYKTTLFVTNPITRTYESLPLIPEQGFMVKTMVLGFDRRTEDSNYVVMVNLNFRTRPFHSTYVFSRSVGQWIPFDYEQQQGKRMTRRERDPLRLPSICRSVCYIDGVFYLFLIKVFEREYIVAVDVDKGLVRKIRMPMDVKNNELGHYSLGRKSNGCLVFGGFGSLEMTREDGQEVKSSLFHVWMLEDVTGCGGENWELKISVDVENFFPVDLDIGIELQRYVIGFDPDYEVVFFRTTDCDLFAISLRSKNIIKICHGVKSFQNVYAYTPLWVDIFAKTIKDR